MANSRPQQAKAARPRSGRRPLATPDAPRGQGAFPIVGIGASAGGLEACRTLLGALAPGNGMAFILVQHLDPTHESMMVDLLAGHTPMTVQQATYGVPIEPDHVYVIPPGTYLSVSNGALHLSQPQARHGARLPFDFLLYSLAENCGPRAICVVLSGTGADGSLGLKAVKEKGGLVIAQEPGEAAYDGMPRSAIATGAVDLVLPEAKMPEALVEYGQRRTPGGFHAPDEAKAWLQEIIDLLRAKTAHDFRLYKPGTLQRRIGLRMALAGVATMDRYIGILRSDTGELDLLAKDLLINVTSFFRDPHVFDVLAEKVVPYLVRSHPSDQPIRIWVAGCSTGGGDLFTRHAVPRRNRVGEEEHQAAGVRFRRRSGCGRPCQGRVLSRDDRGGGVAGETGALLLAGRPRLPGLGRAARRGGVHRAGCAGRSAVLPSRPILSDPRLLEKMIRNCCPTR